MFPIKALVFTLTLLSVMPVSAWEVDDLLFMNEDTQTNPEEDANFQALKSSVKIQLEGSWCSKEKTDLLMDLVYMVRPKVCVEIGAFTGSSVLPVAVALQYIGQGKVYAIDSWSNEEAIRHLDMDDANRGWWNQIDMLSVRRSFDELMNAWNLSTVCTPIPQPSAIAFDMVSDIDFLHLDGNFSEEGSFHDIERYLTKVKQGGYILLSNVYHTVKNKQPKLKTFKFLLETCEFISETDKDNAVLFRKL